MTIATNNLTNELGTGSPNFPNGMPTSAGDPIVESGSNSDGEWTRWADGTQYVASPNFTFTEASGQSRLERTVWTYPAPFLNPVSPQFSLPSNVGFGDGTWDSSNSSQKKVSLAGSGTPSATFADQLRIWSTSTFSAGEFIDDVFLTATGRWK